MLTDTSGVFFASPTPKKSALHPHPPPKTGKSHTPFPSPPPEEEERVGSRSPRIHTSAQITVRPPRMMCCVPWSWERRLTLLPVSVVTYSLLGGFEEVVVEGGIVLVV